MKNISLHKIVALHFALVAGMINLTYGNEIDPIKLEINVNLDKHTYLIGEYIYVDVVITCETGCGDIHFTKSDIWNNLIVKDGEGKEYHNPIHVEYMNTLTFDNEPTLSFRSELVHAWGKPIVHQDSLRGIDYFPPGDYEVLLKLWGCQSNQANFQVVEPNKPEQQTAFDQFINYSEIKAKRRSIPKEKRYYYTLQLENITKEMVRDYPQTIFTSRVLCDFLDTVNWDAKYKNTDAYPKLLDTFITLYPNDEKVTSIQHKEFTYYKNKFGLKTAMTQLDRRINANMSDKLTKHAQTLRSKYSER